MGCLKIIIKIATIILYRKKSNVNEAMKIQLRQNKWIENTIKLMSFRNVFV